MDKAAIFTDLSSRRPLRYILRHDEGDKGILDQIDSLS
jgi:hypothetical protein